MVFLPSESQEKSENYVVISKKFTQHLFRPKQLIYKLKVHRVDGALSTGIVIICCCLYIPRF